ncbi:MAG: hypothetical protein JXA15_00465 [Spirochaetales bacterium]|nr:hypothetical protein [Spirochaetales bacterium]
MKLLQLGALSCSAILALGLAACDPSGTPVEDFRPVVRRELPAEFSARRAVAYSGYREGQSPATEIYPSEAEILEDLQLLVDGGFGLIRLYDASEHAVRTLKVIADNTLDLKAMLGVWIAGSRATHGAENDAQVAAAVALADAYPDTVIALSVGNETLVDWSSLDVPPDDLRYYIDTVRAAVSQPVGTDDNWEPFSLKAEGGVPYADAAGIIKVMGSVDFLAVHTYAYWDSNWDLWDWRQAEVAEADRATAMMDAALDYAKANLRAVREALDGLGFDVPLAIGETGWQNAGYPGRAHPVNQKMYYDRVMGWTYDAAGMDAESPVACFWFEAFNEPWKGGDDAWGLFDVERAPRYVIKDLAAYSALVSPDAALTDADALKYTVLEPRVVTAPSYYVYADTIPTDPAVAMSSLEDYAWPWNFWENDTTGTAAEDTTAAAPEGTNALKVTPDPLVWGWGMAYALKDAPEDLSAFVDAGHLRFKVKTTYAGKLEFGFLTGNAQDSLAVDVYLAVDPASNAYGYANDGAWHEVAIPIAAITARAAPAYGMSGSATLNMAEVYNTFVIADRYATTGNVAGATTEIWLDDVRWTQD